MSDPDLRAVAIAGHTDDAATARAGTAAADPAVRAAALGALQRFQALDVDTLAAAIEHRQRPDHRAAIVDDRRGEHRGRDIADPLGDVAGEAGVARDLLDDQRLAGPDDITGDATGDRKAGSDDLLGASAVGSNARITASAANGYDNTNELRYLSA